MKVTVFGTGYVGLVQGAILAEENESFMGAGRNNLHIRPLTASVARTANFCAQGLNSSMLFDRQNI